MWRAFWTRALLCVMMALEWEQFDDILQREQLDSILESRPFILSFLDQLYTVKYNTLPFPVEIVE